MGRKRSTATLPDAEFIEFDAAKYEQEKADLFAGSDEEKEEVGGGQDEDVSLTDGEEDDDEEGEGGEHEGAGAVKDEEATACDDPVGELLRWGASRKQYWGGDTADLEIGQSADDAADEEELAAEIARHQLSRLDDDDFALEGSATVAADTSIEEANESATRAHAGGLFGRLAVLLSGSRVGVAQRGSLASPASSRSVRALLTSLGDAASELEATVRPSLVVVTRKPARVCLALKEQVLLSLIANLAFLLLLQASGHDAGNHPVLARLASLQRCLATLRPLEPNLGLHPDTADLPSPREAADHSSGEIEASLDDVSLDDGDDGDDANEDARQAVAEHDEQDGDDAAFETVHMAHNNTTTAAPCELRVVATYASSLRRNIGDHLGSEQRVHGDMEVDFSAVSRLDAKTRKHLTGDEREYGSDGPADTDVASNSVCDDASSNRVSDGDGDLQFLRAYGEAVREMDEKHTKKRAKYTVASRFGDWTVTAAEPSVLGGDRRAASKAIVGNKGLAPHKPRKNRNPRVKKKVKYAKALIRRKGQIREAPPADAGTSRTSSYAGEATGIRGAISRSRRLG